MRLTEIYLKFVSTYSEWEDESKYISQIPVLNVYIGKVGIYFCVVRSTFVNIRSYKKKLQ